MARAEAPRRQSLGFLLLYALAWAGGAIAYVPFLTILLPERMSALVGASDVEYLGYVTFCGAVAASLDGIAFGWPSYTTRNRRGLIAKGRTLRNSMSLRRPLAGVGGTLVGIIYLWEAVQQN